MTARNLIKSFIFFVLIIYVRGAGATEARVSVRNEGVKSIIGDLYGVTRGFVKGDIIGLAGYWKNHDDMISDLARAATFRLQGSQGQAISSLNKCIANRVDRGVDAYLHAVCLWVLAGMERENGNHQEFYLRHKEGCDYVRLHEKLIAEDLTDEVTGYPSTADSLVGTCRELGYFSTELYFPKTSYYLKRNWSSFVVKNGYVELHIDDKKVDFLVDTGDGEITINCKVNKEVCEGMRRVGVKYSVDDFTHTFTTRALVAEHIRVGPLYVNNAYLGTTDNAPSTIGATYLKRLGRFVLSKREIRKQKAKPVGASQCVRLVYHYGALDARQPNLLVDVATDIGDLKLQLDTGSTSGPGMPKTALFVYKGSHVDHALIEENVFKTQNVARTQHGSRIAMNVEFFHFAMTGIAGTKLTGLVSPGPDYASGGSDGVLGGALVDQLSMWLDFDQRRVCFFPPVEGNDKRGSKTLSDAAKGVGGS